MPIVIERLVITGQTYVVRFTSTGMGPPQRAASAPPRRAATQLRV